MDIRVSDSGCFYSDILPESSPFRPQRPPPLLAEGKIRAAHIAVIWCRRVRHDIRGRPRIRRSAYLLLDSVCRSKRPRRAFLPFDQDDEDSPFNMTKQAAAAAMPNPSFSTGRTGDRVGGLRPGFRRMARPRYVHCCSLKHMSDTACIHHR